MTAAGTPVGHPPVGRDASTQILGDKVNRLLRGEINCTQNSVTLRASQTTTTLKDPRIQANSFIDAMPLTANAATAKSSIWYSNFVAANATTPGSCTINHASSANVDQTFNFLIVG